jgi:hypothetical protein
MLGCGNHEAQFVRHRNFEAVFCLLLPEKQAVMLNVCVAYRKHISDSLGFASAR